MLNLSQTIEQAQSSYERQQLLDLIKYFILESTTTEDMKAIVRELHYEVNARRITRNETPLPDLKYFGL